MNEDNKKPETEKEVDSNEDSKEESKKEDSSSPVEEKETVKNEESDSNEEDSEKVSDDKEDIDYKEKYLSLKNKVDQDTKENDFNKILKDKNIPEENHPKIKDLLRNSENVSKDLDILSSMINKKATVSNSLEVKENNNKKEEKKGTDNWTNVGAV